MKATTPAAPSSLSEIIKLLKEAAIAIKEAQAAEAQSSTNAR